MMTNFPSPVPCVRVLLSLALAGGFGWDATTADARILLKNICRVKGQEENTLHGLGLVVGLKGSGDGGEFLPTIRSLATALQLMGSPLGRGGPVELKDAKNVALVMVTVTVPAAGARQGDKLDCVVSSIGAAKSLNGGTLFSTPLQGPQVGNSRVYAFAQGQLHIDDVKAPTTAKIHQGCRLEEDFYNVFSKDGKITLVLDKNHADFQVAQDTAELINSQLNYQNTDGYLARALNQVNIEVSIPPQYREDPVLFISQVLSLPTLDPQPEARVVINERTGSVVVSGDVEIGSVVVTHKNIVIETGSANASANRFVPLDTDKTATAKLKALVEALNAVKVAPEDMIDIIKSIERNGKLHGALIIE
jgi:flagellar P-ring protein precursor FlgI